MKYFIGILFYSLSWSVMVTGYIKDNVTLKPIENVNIFVKDSEYGTTSNADGYFQINFKDSVRYDLSISHVGYKKKVVILDSLYNKTDLNILLEETFYQINDIIITATRTPKKLKDVPISTEVINSNEINESEVENLSELLELRSGISVASSVQGENTISMLGMDSKYILVLVDGHPITGKFNSRVSLNQIPIQNIEKVEIIKGPSSSLYGSEAMGGVINIITNKASGKNIDTSIKYNSSEKNYNPFNLDKGTRIFDIKYSNKINNINYKFFSGIKHINVDNKNKYSNLDNIVQANLNSIISWNINKKHNMNLSISKYYNNEESKSFSKNNNISVNRNNYNILYDWLYSDVLSFQKSFRFGNYSRIKKIQYIDGTRKPDNETNEDDIEIELNGIYEKEFLTYNFGTEIIKSKYFGDRISNEQQRAQTISLYSQFDINPINKTNIVIGIRYDNHNRLESVYSPRIAAMYSFNKYWKYRASWGKGFRTPSSQELFFDWFNDLGGGTGYKVIGNPILKPEISNGLNMGFEYFHPSIYKVSLIFYRTKFYNMIKDTNIPKIECSEENTNWDYGCLSYINIDSVEYNGLELQGSFNLSNDWKAEWGFNWIDNYDLSTNQPLPNTQKYSSKFNLTHKLNKIPFSYAIQFKWIGSYYPMEYVPENNNYITSDIKRKAQYYINYHNTWNLNKTIIIKSGIKNILNEIDTTYGPFIGRVYYLKINIGIE